MRSMKRELDYCKSLLRRGFNYVIELDPNREDTKDLATARYGLQESYDSFQGVNSQFWDAIKSEDWEHVSNHCEALRTLYNSMLNSDWLEILAKEYMIKESKEDTETGKEDPIGEINEELYFSNQIDVLTEREVQKRLRKIIAGKEILEEARKIREESKERESFYQIVEDDKESSPFGDINLLRKREKKAYERGLVEMADLLIEKLERGSSEAPALGYFGLDSLIYCHLSVVEHTDKYFHLNLDLSNQSSKNLLGNLSSFVLPKIRKISVTNDAKLTVLMKKFLSNLNDSDRDIGELLYKGKYEDKTSDLPDVFLTEITGPGSIVSQEKTYRFPSLELSGLTLRNKEIEKLFKAYIQGGKLKLTNCIIKGMSQFAPDLTEDKYDGKIHLSACCIQHFNKFSKISEVMKTKMDHKMEECQSIP